MSNWFADAVDAASTKFNLPEVGLSELFGQGKTQNTGRVNYSVPAASYLWSANPAVGAAALGSYLGATSGGSSATGAQKGTPQNNGQQQPNGQGIATSYTGGGGGGVSAPARDLAAESYLQSGIDQLNNTIGGLGAKQNTAIQNLVDSYNNGKARRQVQYSDNESDKNRQVDKITSDNERKKTKIDTSVRNNISSLQRLLGSRGAGSSSAATELVPYAAATEGTAERSDANDTYAGNMDTTNTNWDRYRRTFDQNELDAQNDLNNQQNSVKSGFAEQGQQARQKLQELTTNLASARGGDRNAINSVGALTAQINDLAGKIAEYAKQSQARVINAKDTAYQSADLKSYSDQPSAGVQQGAQTDPQYDQSEYYYGDATKKSDDDLLKQLYGTA